MSQMSQAIDVLHTNSYGDTARVLRRTIIIGLIAFLTVVDLFATQAILPSLAQAYRVTPAAMSFAVNASTMGMAVAGLSVAFFSRRIDRRLGILISLCVLAIPTALLAIAPDLTTFTILRVTQGLCMASAFTLMLAYLGEECSATDAGGANSETCASQYGTAGSASLTVPGHAGTEKAAVAASEVAGMTFDSPAT